MNSVQEQIHFIQSDLFEALPEDKFDVIVSNPPYIPTGRLNDLPEEVRNEPSPALDGGKDGLEFYRRIFKDVKNFLHPQGCLVLEIGEDQKRFCSDIARANGFASIEFRQDLCGRDRVLISSREAVPGSRN